MEVQEHGVIAMVDLLMERIREDEDFRIWIWEQCEKSGRPTKWLKEIEAEIQNQGHV